MEFIRKNTSTRGRLGKTRRRNKQVWRRAKGRQSKIREKKKNKPRNVEIGYRTQADSRYLINDKQPVLIRNLKEMEKTTNKSIIIIARMGKRKRQEIIKKAEEKSIQVLNMPYKKK